LVQWPALSQAWPGPQTGAVRQSGWQVPPPHSVPGRQSPSAWQAWRHVPKPELFGPLTQAWPPGQGRDGSQTLLQKPPGHPNRI
jgi:hypothetical protein